jgi:hypothetical protein
MAKSDKINLIREGGIIIKPVPKDSVFSVTLQKLIEGDQILKHCHLAL